MSPVVARSVSIAPELGGRQMATGLPVWAARNAMKEMYFAPSTSRRQRVLAALKDAKEWMELKEENGLPY